MTATGLVRTLRARRRHPVAFAGSGVLLAEHALMLGLALHMGSERLPSERQRTRWARRRQLRDFGSLMATFIKHPRQVGALVPTSKSTVRTMLDMTEWGQVSRVVELGAGTGVYTEELLRRVGPDAIVVAFEIDPGLACRLTGRFHDRRLRVINESAENLAAHLNGHKADVIVSALPFTTLPRAVREAVLSAITDGLDPNGVMLAIQYSAARQRDLERVFGAVRRQRALRNVPPALVYACRKPVRSPRASD